MSAEHDVRGKTHYGESATAKRHTVICKQNRWDRSEFSLNLFLLTAWPFAKVVAWQTRGLYSPTLIQRTLTASLHIIICCKQSRTVIIIYAHTMPGPEVTVSANRGLLFLVETTKKKATCRKAMVRRVLLPLPVRVRKELNTPFLPLLSFRQ